MVEVDAGMVAVKVVSICLDPEGGGRIAKECTRGSVEVRVDEGEMVNDDKENQGTCWDEGEVELSEKLNESFHEDDKIASWEQKGWGWYNMNNPQYGDDEDERSEWTSSSEDESGVESRAEDEDMD